MSAADWTSTFARWKHDRRYWLVTSCYRSRYRGVVLTTMDDFGTLVPTEFNALHGGKTRISNKKGGTS